MKPILTLFALLLVVLLSVSLADNIVSAGKIVFPEGSDIADNQKDEADTVFDDDAGTTDAEEEEVFTATADEKEKTGINLAGSDSPEEGELAQFIFVKLIVFLTYCFMRSEIFSSSSE